MPNEDAHPNEGMIIVDPLNRTRKGLFDQTIPAPVTQNIEHYMRHQGLSFEVHIESAFTAVASIIGAFKVPASSKKIDLFVDWHASDLAQLDFYEDPSWDSASGSAVSIINPTRDSLNTSIIQGDQSGSFVAGQVVKDPTTFTGTTFHTLYNYTTKQSGGGGSTGRHGWELKNDTLYGFKITKGGSNCLMGIILHWFEHIPA